jgi:hypothetical protein
MTEKDQSEQMTYRFLNRLLQQLRILMAQTHGADIGLKYGKFPVK